MVKILLGSFNKQLALFSIIIDDLEFLNEHVCSPGVDCGCFPGKYVQSLTVKEKVVEEATVSAPTVGASGMPHVYAIIDMDFSHRTPDDYLYTLKLKRCQSNPLRKGSRSRERSYKHLQHESSCDGVKLILTAFFMEKTAK